MAKDSNKRIGAMTTFLIANSYCLHTIYIYTTCTFTSVQRINTEKLVKWLVEQIICCLLVVIKERPSDDHSLSLRSNNIAC